MLNKKRNSLSSDGWLLEPFIDHSLSEKFDCGDEDLNEFFRKDLEPYEKELLTKTYMLFPEGAPGGQLVALISFCNDSIRLRDIEESLDLPDAKKHPYLPAVKIARIGVRTDLCGKGIGTHLLNMTKMLFLKENRTGCRILTVDAYNKERVLNFYKKNHFDFVTPKDNAKNTRTMFYDLMRTIITPPASTT